MIKNRYIVTISIIILLAYCNGSENGDKNDSRIHKGIKRVVADGAIDLGSPIHLPKEKDMELGMALESPRQIEIDARSQLLISDSKAKCIFFLDGDDNYINKIGKGGQGPGEFMSVSEIAVSNEKIAAYDPFNNRIQIFSCGGEYISGFKSIKNITSMHWSKRNELVASTSGFDIMRQNEFELFDEKGILLKTYGKPVNSKWDANLLNSKRIEVSDKGDIYIGFKFLNKIIKYNDKCIKDMEIKVKDGILIEREKNNIYIANNVENKRKRRYIATNESIFVIENEIYVLTNFYFPIIFVCNQEGVVLRSYYYKKQTFATDFVIKKTQDVISVYLLTIYPDPSIEKFNINK